jgi:hypothetical protein
MIGTRQPPGGAGRRQKRLELSPVQVIASVLAALTGALAASYLGVAGTIIGAAVVSFATTVGTAVYRYFLSRTKDRLRSAATSMSPLPRPPAQHRALPEPGDPSHGTPGPRQAARTTDDAATGFALLAGLHEADPGGLPGHPGSRPSDRSGQAGHGRRRWLELAGAIAMTFVLTMALITGIELAVGKPLDAIIWHRHETGTSISHVVHRPARSPGSSPPRTRAPESPSASTSRSAPATHSRRPAATHRASTAPVTTTPPATPSPSPTSPGPSPTTPRKFGDPAESVTYSRAQQQPRPAAELGWPS